MSDPAFLQLREALLRRLEVIADHSWRDRDPAGHLEALKAASLAISEVALPPKIDPHLAHYLKQCSYDKALAFLENL